MFKDSENSTIELYSGYTNDIMKNSIEFYKNENVMRIILNVNDKNDVIVIQKYINEIRNINCLISIDEKNINIEQVINLGCQIVVKNSTVKKIKENKNENVFYEVTYNDDILDELKENNNIIWIFKFDKKKWNIFENEIDKLITSGYNFKKEILIKNILLSRDIIQEHPCNVYMCENEKCHGRHSSIPRYITIDKDGNMYPYQLKNEKFRLGNIQDYNNEFLSNKINCDAAKNFIEINRKQYLSLLDKCNFNFIPWFELLSNNYDN